MLKACYGSDFFLCLHYKKINTNSYHSFIVLNYKVPWRHTYPPIYSTQILVSLTIVVEKTYLSLKILSTPIVLSIAFLVSSRNGKGAFLWISHLNLNKNEFLIKIVYYNSILKHLTYVFFFFFFCCIFRVVFH